MIPQLGLPPSGDTNSAPTPGDPVLDFTASTFQMLGLQVCIPTLGGILGLKYDFKHIGGT